MQISNAYTNSRGDILVLVNKINKKEGAFFSVKYEASIGPLQTIMLH